MKLTTYFRLVFRYRMSTALFPLLSRIFMCRDIFWFYLYTTLRHPYQARPRMTPFLWKIDEGWNCPVKVLRKKLQRGITIAAPIFSLIKDSVQIRSHAYVSLSLKGTSVFYVFPTYRLIHFSISTCLWFFWVFYSFFTKHY